MSICGICFKKIEDGKPYDDEHLSYDGCENEIFGEKNPLVTYYKLPREQEKKR